MTEERNHKLDMRERLAREGAELVGTVSLLAAVLGVLAAFLGWRAGTAYLLSFGLHPGWESTDVIGLIVTAWVEVLVILVLIAFCVVGRQATLRWAQAASPAMLVRLFLFCLCLGVIVTAIYLVGWLVPGAFSIGYVQFGFLLGLLFVLWWIFAVIGEYLYADLGEALSRTRRILSLVFSSRAAIILLTLAFGALYVMNLAALRGAHFGSRDKSVDSHLPYVTVISEAPLGIPAAQLTAVPATGEQLYLYGDLRLIGRQEDHLFAFRPSETDPNTGAVQVYGIPLDNIVSMQIREWYWPAPAPISTP